ncbi:phage portal protein family protein [Parabacteroides distasonis]
MLDALLTSQIEQRIGRTLSLEFSLKDASGKVDEEATRTLSSAVWFPLLIRYMLESVFYGHSLVEFSTSETDGIGVTLIPRQNVVPEQGLLLYDSTADEGAYYRELREYGTYVVEFGAPGNYGLLNKAVPHALFKKFAHSCWSELCEIYGIPPRYIKTNTQDPAMLDRAEDMLRDMGSAAYFIIDTTEEFQFAQGVSTNGDVYNNLISLCNSEMSLLISGAQIGQDTKNGNRSKEEVGVKQLEKYVNSDKRQVEDWMNSIVLPALFRIGFLPDGLRFSFNSEEDTGQLWERTAQAMQYYEIDPTWIKDKFGIEVTGKRSSGQEGFFGSAPKENRG